VAIFKLHQYIHVAFRPEVIPENRAENGEAAYMVSPTEVGNSVKIDWDLDYHVVTPLSVRTWGSLLFVGAVLW
jgi:hypothetical protein